MILHCQILMEMKDQLTQLFVNLLKNSVEAIDEVNGIIKISTKIPAWKITNKSFY